jgi:hypothetical protein
MTIKILLTTGIRCSSSPGQGFFDDSSTRKKIGLRSGRNEPQKMVRYCLTSLPIAPHLRRLGHRRWGCEPMFRDFKSSGWDMQQSGLQDPHTRHTLLLVLSINYLWASSLGRWLCKVGRRHEIDGKKNGITAYFVLVGIGSFINIKWKVPSQHF